MTLILAVSLSKPLPGQAVRYCFGAQKIRHFGI